MIRPGSTKGRTTLGVVAVGSQGKEALNFKFRLGVAQRGMKNWKMVSFFV